MIANKPSNTAQYTCLVRALDWAWRGKSSIAGDEFAQLYLQGAFAAAYHAGSGGLGRFVSPIFSGPINDWILLRHAYIDKLIKEKGADKPVVLLGSGYDSRGLRLREHLSRGLVEIDFPATGRAKQESIQKLKLSHAHIKYVEADFIQESLPGIFRKFAAPGEQALIVWEGVSMYVPNQVVRDTIRQVGEFFGSGSILVADFLQLPSGLRPVLEATARSPLARLLQEPVMSGYSPDELANLTLSLNSAAGYFLNISRIRNELGLPTSILPCPLFLGIFNY